MTRGLSAPAAERNREPIAQVLERVLPEHGVVLELASGTGQHAVHFAARLPGLVWQPSDVDPIALASIGAWVDEAALRNLRGPLAIDVRSQTWPIDRTDAVVCINMLHISEWECCDAVFSGAARLGASVVALYGPYRIRGRPTAASNEQFDRSLRDSNPAWGVRRLADVEAVALEHGYALDEIVDMPANNVTVVFRRGD
jgi:hypothetical protein